jgi:hypothetical protein
MASPDPIGNGHADGAARHPGSVWPVLRPRNQANRTPQKNPPCAPQAASRREPRPNTPAAHGGGVRRSCNRWQAPQVGRTAGNGAEPTLHDRPARLRSIAVNRAMPGSPHRSVAHSAVFDDLGCGRGRRVRKASIICDAAALRADLRAGRVCGARRAWWRRAHPGRLPDCACCSTESRVAEFDRSYPVIRG